MKRKFLVLVFFVLISSFSVGAAFSETYGKEEEFVQWLDGFKKIAREKHKIKDEVLNSAFKDVKFNPKIVETDRNQPEFVRTFWSYYENVIDTKRINEGKKRLINNQKLLKEVQKKYNVQPQILIAFWGIETDYGRNIGKSSILSTLTTLAFDHRRSSFFTEELVFALKIVQSGKISLENFKGSWAGAFGNFQFLPSTFTKYAVDGDKDGKIDPYNSLADSLYSAANYLSKMGWNGGQRWGRVVSFDREDQKIWREVNSKDVRNLDFFSKLGVKTQEGKLLPKASVKARLIAPMGIEGPVFLVYENFTYIMRWNNSVNYALSVGLLSDYIVSNKPARLKK